MREGKNSIALMLKGTLHGLAASTAFWLILGCVSLAFWTPARAILVAGVGFALWGVIWGVAGAIIGAVGSNTAKWKSVGFACGIIIGVLSAMLPLAWLSDAEGSVLEKVQWAIAQAVGMPVMFWLTSLNALLLNTINVSLVEGHFFAYRLVVTVSALSWGAFGALLGALIGRVPKLKLP